MQEPLLARGAAGLSTADLARGPDGAGWCRGEEDSQIAGWATGCRWYWLESVAQGAATGEQSWMEMKCRGKVCGCLCSPRLDSVFGVPRTWWWCLSAGLELFQGREEKCEPGAAVSIPEG